MERAYRPRKAAACCAMHSAWIWLTESEPNAESDVPHSDKADADKERIMDEKTRREVFSMAALQGILASQSPETHRSPDQLSEVAQLARTYPTSS